MVTARYCHLKSSPWCNGNPGPGQDLVIYKQVPGIIMESLSYLRWADLYLLADTAHGLQGTLLEPGLKGRSVTVYSP